MFSYRALKSIANCIICIGGRKEAGSVFFFPCFESLPFSLGKERKKLKNFSKVSALPKERKKIGRILLFLWPEWGEKESSAGL